MKEKYDVIGNNYNKTRKADKFITTRLFELLNPNNDSINLDIGCGTGNYTNEFQKKGIKFIGIDPSNKMISMARKSYPNIEWKSGSATNTGLAPNSIDSIIATLTIHHWTNLTMAFEELKTVLKPNGTMVIFTSTPVQMKGYWLNHYFPKMMAKSINQMPSFEYISESAKKAGFTINLQEPYFISPNLEDHFLYCGKHNPKMYLNSTIRNGISSFSSLANKDEIITGLKNLKLDIEKGKIEEVMNRYNNSNGDYLFIKLKKSKTSL